MLLVHVSSQSIPRLQYLWAESALVDDGGDVGLDVLLHRVLQLAREAALGAVPGGFHLEKFKSQTQITNTNTKKSFYLDWIVA